MAKKKLIGLLLICALAFSVVACSGSGNDETAASDAQSSSEETTSEETEPTARPYDKEANQEFEDEVLYEVTKEVVAYADLDATEVAETYSEGMCISGVATDGFYVMQNNGYIIQADCLEKLE